MAEQAERSTLMNDLHESVDSQIDQVTESVEEETNVETVVKDQDSLVSEEFAKDSGLPIEFVGKPMKEVSKAIRKLNAGYTQKSQALSELGKKVEQLEKSITSQAATVTEKKEAQEVIDEIPDPVTDRQGFNKWLENRDKRKETELEKKIGDLFESKFGSQLKTVEEYTTKQRENQIMTAITDSVEEGTDVNDLILEWAEEYGVKGNDIEIDYWMKHPEKMAKSVITFHESQQYKVLSQKDAKQVGDEAVKKASKLIKETQNKKITDLNSVKREPTEKRTPLMADLMESVEE